MSTVLDELVNKTNDFLDSYLRKNYKQRFSFGHPAAYIKPPIEYCLNAVREDLSRSGDLDPNDFLRQFRFCMTDITSAIARTAAETEKFIESYASQLKGGGKKAEETQAVSR